MDVEDKDLVESKRTQDAIDLFNDEEIHSPTCHDKCKTSSNIQEQNFLKEKLAMENEFGKKRAKFKEIYLQKEDEFNKLLAEAETLRKERVDYREDAKLIQKELDEVKSLLTIAEYTKENEIEVERRRCQEEIASLRRILEESVNDAKQSAALAVEKELTNLKRMNTKLEAERHDASIINKERLQSEGVLSAVTKSLKRSVGGLSANLEAACQTDCIENLEESMYKAQQDAEMLRSLVVPLEQEIHGLKDQIRSKDEKLKLFEHAKAPALDEPADSFSLLQNKKSSDVVGDLDEKMNTLSLDLEAEKSSRSDLEMYVGVLSAQKNVLQMENDKIQKELVEICKMLENEKRDHVELKQTWQRANDQFLESQRLQIIEMRRMQSVLSEEQQRQILLIQTQEEEENKKKQEQELIKLREAENKHKESLELDKSLRRVKSSRSFRKKKRSNKVIDKNLLNVENSSFSSDKALSDSDLAIRASPMNATTPTTDSIRRLRSEDSPVGLRRAYSSSAVSLYKEGDDVEFQSRQGSADDNLSELCAETQSLHEIDSFRWSPDLPVLTEAQKKALTGDTRESEARKVMLDSARSNISATYDILSVPLAGKRLVSESEWLLLQQELKGATEKLGRPCDMCNNYETQLQRVQHEIKEKEQHSKTVQQMLDRYKDDLKKEQAFRQELELKLSSLSEQAQKEVNAVYVKLEESEKVFADMKSLYTSCYAEIKSQMKSLVQEREEVQKELTKLQKDNDSLTAKYSAQAQEMQNEVINLPNNLEDMQLLLLKYREEIISAKVSKQHTEETLHSEIMFLRDQVKAEQTAKDRIEDQLMQELESIRENTGITESIKSELERERALRIEYEKSLKESHVQIKQTQEKSRHTITTLQRQFEEVAVLKSKLESDVYQLRSKVSSLQTDLENSEAVQRDFVKLSQNLQVQLEKIRQSEKEVRWQHEDDVEECSNCKQNFTVTRRKHHCRHCGKIFCADCTAKIVYSGPHKRQSKVCDVCHTLLVPNIAPYFSNELPHTPD